MLQCFVTGCRVPFSISVTAFIHKKERQREERREESDKIRVETFTFLGCEALKTIEDKIKGKKKVNTLKSSDHETNFKEDKTEVQKTFFGLSSSCNWLQNEYQLSSSV